MDPLLFLAHRLPYPPDKGDRIRSFNLVRHLSRNFRVRLAAFDDEADDGTRAAALGDFCEAVLVRRIRPRLRRLGCARALLAGEALTVEYCRDRGIARWVRDQVGSRGVRRVVAFSSGMAQYARGSRYAGVHRMVDMVDVDSEKWRAYGSRHRGPMGWLYRREADRLLAFERAVAAEFDVSVFVSAEEAALFQRLAPESAARVRAIGNGVDAEYFSPDREYPDPYAAGGRTLVFTGAMDYWANVDAVCWFAEAIFPAVRSAVADARLSIVGANPTDRVRALARAAGIEVTGRVPDVRPYLHHARAAIAPLRIARGVQNKVLEAMAMAKPVIATAAAMEGLRIPPALHRLVADSPERLAQNAIAVLADGVDPGIGPAGRAQVRAHYDWAAQLALFDRLLV